MTAALSLHVSGLTAGELTTAILEAKSPSDALAAKTDEELADLLLEGVLIDERIPSERYSIVQAAVDRLRVRVWMAESAVRIALRDESMLKNASAFTFGRFTAKLWAHTAEGRWGVEDSMGRVYSGRMDRDAAVELAKDLDEKDRATG